MTDSIQQRIAALLERLRIRKASHDALEIVDSTLDHTEALIRDLAEERERLRTALGRLPRIVRLAQNGKGYDFEKQ